MKVANILRKLSWWYHAAKTLLFYRVFLKKCDGNFVIINPIIFTQQHCIIGKNVFIRNNARIEGVDHYEHTRFYPLIQIGENVSIEQNVHLTCADKIIIGSNTAIASNVTITDINHCYTDINLPPEKQPLQVNAVTIGTNCKIYNNAVILPGTILGTHNIVGANSVVSGVFPDYCVIAGAPAKIVKRHNPSTKNWEKVNQSGEFIN
ncbi:acetyltransferase [Mucilaginibacter gotjawali]|uniref:Galactoside O-acetyltransferase n=2 Tax=Mucilaginibacter gotjawali TaxID=1550579 RepID=A0A110B3R0_9SPHI|nr:acetyltransferase [Mucilaginibacter gotjawali]MBB3058526.1 acetyltransferase-like isoleucine patch superfamily enzyme [Mucilaginibacter gotjawali]BAU55750.1 Galactoside O-acetyltransferase [Mucilaginibacter gotjawali]